MSCSSGAPPASELARMPDPARRTPLGVVVLVAGWVLGPLGMELSVMGDSPGR